MLAVNVQESTTTTGTGDITLAGTSEGGRTFTSQFATNERLSYYIDDRAGNWEHGIGYLSGASTLVRETVVDNSLSTTALINFSAGTKQVFNAKSASLQSPLVPSGTRYISLVMSDADSVAQLFMGRLSYMPIPIKSEITVNTIGVSIVTASATGIMHLGLCRSTDELYPGERIINASSISTTATGITSQAVSSITLKPGLYWGALYVDETVNFSGYNTGQHTNIGIGATGSLLTSTTGYLNTSPGAITEIPLNTTASINFNGGSAFTIFMDVV